MRAVRVHQQGEPEVMQVDDLPIPEPGAGQARIKIAASGVNFIDIYQRSGAYKLPLPFTLGQEAAGTIDAIGESVTDFKVGDRVAYAFVLGAYAEYAIVPLEKLVPIPDGVDERQAAAALLQGMTAQYLVTDTFPIQPGQTVLVHAAAGATGQLLVQLAKLRGAKVLATASTEAKLKLAQKAGADAAFLYDDFEAGVKEITAGKGVDAVYDSVGKDTFDRSLNCLCPRGYMVLFGQSSGAVSPLEPQLLNAKGSLFLTRPSLGHYLLTRDELLGRAGDVFGWIKDGKLKVRIDSEFPLTGAAEAHHALNSRGTTGKVLLIP